jgi:tetrahydromethanopterin S-methyltransferase subunit G
MEEKVMKELWKVAFRETFKQVKLAKDRTSRQTIREAIKEMIEHYTRRELNERFENVERVAHKAWDEFMDSLMKKIARLVAEEVAEVMGVMLWEIIETMTQEYKEEDEEA